MATEQRLERFRQVAARRQRGLILVLEDIHDPHNAEACFRTCDAFGVQEVALIFDSERPFNPRRFGKATSASANKWLDYRTFRTTKRCLAWLHRRGYEIVAAVADPRAGSVGRTKFRAGKIAVLIGNERRGLSPQALALADRRVTIPMRGMVQSLNLAVTASLFLFEVTRQRIAAGDLRQTTPAERRRLVASFARR